MLRHPIMALFAYTKWHPHKIMYVFNLFIFLAFLWAFTYHGILTIDLIQCELILKDGECDRHWKPNPNLTQCQEAIHQSYLVFPESKYICYFFLVTLILWECLQFLSKVFEENRTLVYNEKLFDNNLFNLTLPYLKAASKLEF